MIRKATQKDFDFIYELHVHPQVNLFLFYEIMSEDEFKIIFNGLLEQGILYVYEEDETLKGMFKLVPKEHRASHIVFLGGVAIHPSFSGKGCGQRMLNEIISFGKEMGFLRMELGVSTINEKAIHLYEKAGFKREGILKKYIHLKRENIFLDDILMAYLYE
ncbi:MAG TPA: GNAT family protein [Chitinophagaceae bacterium]|nr:GNAT family protein [Chitinophagaceae bacterium]